MRTSKLSKYHAWDDSGICRDLPGRTAVLSAAAAVARDGCEGS
jgi:hypothetical protein